ncbi:helix-turn-helix transcriptional regulator [bacterium]|nr:helix-turn-helix transcriptional regulator [bacterium]
MDIKKELGQKIKRIRQNKGITQEQLAEMTGISTRTLGGIEIGENFMTAQTMEKIIECLNISINDLFTAEHLRPTEELIKEIHAVINSHKNDRIKIEEIYKVIKAIATI